ncbi:hypothetical protein BU23DRAFT_561352 [Bimuria novae-zelandiae CBS 107.79]|uniref:Uncharacterized protein n=1 Tax=Bimuria novae-zelandiae CBS 107.79 TaxID=1447943 RepID=A0A6A5UKB9_9PLEO|nr:hypothetical protein BU23DRAFT_561352 [Bimuria novae-zelandiae CBS 107.79]
MPLFGSRREPSPEPAPTRSSGLFSSHKTTSPPPTRNRSIFNRRRLSSPSLTSTSPTGKRHSHSLLHKSGGEDASIVAARERVMSAETAEREADRALFAAKAAVRDAREHVKALEREAAEQARLAKVKQQAARNIGKRGKALGRHDHV